MENCVKAILYCYPSLGGVEEGYYQHIKNKAVLSSDGRLSAQRAAEDIALEILRKGKVRELKNLATMVISKLTTEEKLLLDVRYFGKMDRVKRIFAAKYAGIADEEMNCIKIWSERTYFRKQKRLLIKLVERFEELGLTKERFANEFAELDGVSAVYTYVELGKDVCIEKREQAFLSFLERIRN